LYLVWLSGNLVEEKGKGPVILVTCQLGQG